MLIGEYTTKVGDKKRIALPKPFRDEMGEKLIITRGYEGSLVIVNEQQWKTIAKEVINGSFVSRNVRDMSRFLVGSASEVNLDKQGRFVIPTPLFEHAKLQNECVVVGLVNWVEIWSKEEWERRMTYITENADLIADELSKLSTDE